MKTPIFRLLLLLLLGGGGLGTAHAQTLAEAAEAAAARTTLDRVGTPPFHLLAKIREEDPESDYNGTLEIHWLAPDKFRRVIHTVKFSQTLVRNGEKTFEQDEGDYFPIWLRNLTTAVMSPIPMLEQLRKVDRQLKNLGSATESCMRFVAHVGTPPAQNSIVYDYCFDREGRPKSMMAPPFDATFENFSRFHNFEIARKVTTEPDAGLFVMASITKLEDLGHTDEALLSIPAPTPSAQQIQHVQVAESTAKSVLEGSPEIRWKPVPAGKTNGTLSIYVSTDRLGYVRETLPLNSDNPHPQDDAREQISKWRFKPVLYQGTPAQMETILTFAFNTQISSERPVLSDSEVRALATHIVDAKVKSPATIRVSIGADGKLQGAGNPNNLPNDVFMPAYQAATEWHFKPLIRDGKPVEYDADITFAPK